MKKKIFITESQFNTLISEMTNMEINTRCENVDLHPTEGQKRAGNYRMGHITFAGFKISIENPKGSKRYWKDENGKEKYTVMKHHYGYFSNSLGHDNDHVDVFLGKNQDCEIIYIVDQKNQYGEFDESKVMLGFNSIKEAKKAYLSNFSPNWTGFMSITGVDKTTFKKWLYRGRKQQKPFADYINIIKSKINENNIKTNKLLKENHNNTLLDIAENYYAFNVLDEFLTDKNHGITERQWQVISKDAYRNALINFMQYGEAFRTPEKLIDRWLEIIYYNVLTLHYITELAGHASYFPFDDLHDTFDDWEDCPKKDTYEEWSKFLDNIGFYDWCKLPDGSDAWSDFGLKPLWGIISKINDNTSKVDKLIAVNKCLDVTHQRGDLASAFIEGGKQSCYDISNN